MSTSRAAAAVRVRSSAVGHRVRVRVQGDGRAGVSERALNRHHIAPGRDQAGGVEVPEIVELGRRVAASRRVLRHQ